MNNNSMLRLNNKHKRNYLRRGNQCNAKSRYCNFDGKKAKKKLHRLTDIKSKDILKCAHDYSMAHLIFEIPEQ